MAASIARPLLLALPLLLVACAHAPGDSASAPSHAAQAPRPVAGSFEPLPAEVLAEAAGQTVVLKCLITTRGTVERCQVLQGLSPAASASLVQNFETRRYEPAIFQGRPVDVDYTFNLLLKAPTPKPAS